MLIVMAPAEVDLETAPEFAERVQAALEQFPDVLVIDFVDTQFIGAAGIDVLVYAKEVVENYGGRLAVRHASAPLRRLLELTPEFERAPGTVEADDTHV